MWIVFFERKPTLRLLHTSSGEQLWPRSDTAKFGFQQIEPERHEVYVRWLGRAVEAMMDGRAEEYDRVVSSTMRWDLGIGSEHNHDVVWRCDGMRAGKLYSRIMFGSREEAEQFAHKMRRSEPDQMFNVESVAASSVWN